MLRGRRLDRGSFRHYYVILLKAKGPEGHLRRSIIHTATSVTRMWANAQPDGRPAEHRWRPLFNAAKFG